MKQYVSILLLTLLSLPSWAQRGPETLTAALRDYFAQYKAAGYKPATSIKMERYSCNDSLKTISVTANESFCSQPFTPNVVKGIYTLLQQQLPQPYNTYRITILTGDGQSIEELIPNIYRDKNTDKGRLWGDTDYDGAPWVRNTSLPYSIKKGLQNRHIMVWPSHGRYYKNGKWEWQRPYLFCTTEDLYTQSFVNPFLIPMLQNAGAVVCSARERDYQTATAVVDNDTIAHPQGEYAEQDSKEAAWETAPGMPGFALPQGDMTDLSLPFRAGTARQVVTTTRKSQNASVTWMPDIPQAGAYSVYVSYATCPNSVSDAKYTVYHKGGRTNFTVNQQMGGGTWVYLGTFEFDKGTNREGRVVLTNQSNHRGVVTADAVRFGGGMSRTQRGSAGTSGLPAYLEAARYYTQWAGLPDSLFNPFQGRDDYKDDIRARSFLLNYLGGGSPYMPGIGGMKVPFELSLAVHSDAGHRNDNSVYGTLGICTTDDGNGNRLYPSGLSRQASFDFANILLTHIASDMSRFTGREWTRRETWDRNYGESRTPDVPSAILETMSHQNFTDVRYGHDPNFKFAFSRSIYKAILDFVNTEHGIRDYAVQPLPPRRFSALLEGSNVRLRWTETVDSVEAKARPTAYVVYTRIGDGGFDNGQRVEGTSLTLPVAADTRYGFRVTAINAGGESFPSQTLSVYRASAPVAEVLIVNGFDRLSGPAVIDTPDSLGFDLKADIGVPYVCSTAFAGYQTCFRRSAAGTEGPGALGYCDSRLVGVPIAGNTFDYPALHGAAMAAAGCYSYSSTSKEAALDIDWSSYSAIDYIAGLERDVAYNLRPYKTFDKEMRQKMSACLRLGGNILVSGAYIASDMQAPEEQNFTAEAFKYRYAGSKPSPASTDSISGLRLMLPLCRELGDATYALQSSDVVVPTDDRAFVAFTYADGQPAGVAWRGKSNRTIAMAFPFESITSAPLRAKAMKAMLQFLINP